jgi:hypothetical protein
VVAWNRARLEKVKNIADPLKRRLFVLAVITAGLEPYHLRPVLIGGGAVEYYTFGGYALNGYVHWQWQDDRRWAARMIALHGETLDWDYLRRRSTAEQAIQALAEIESEWRNDPARKL